MYTTVCGAVESDIALPTPPNAIDVKHAKWNDGYARQTYFTMRAEYPTSPAWDHYSKVVGQPWVPCTGADKGAWQSFLDGTKTPVVSVHQQMHAWVDPTGRRTLTLAIRYTSDRDFDRRPDNNEQHVFLVEYRDVDVDNWKVQLQLTCGASSPAKVD